MKVARRSCRIWNEENGQALVLGTLCMAMLMAAMTLTVDVGYMHYRQAQLQTAADSAAIAAGLEINNCANTVCANMKTAAEQALIEDGITSSTITPKSSCTVSSTTSLAMIINVAPCALGSSDPNNGNNYMAEVVLTEPQSTFFGSLFGIPTFNLVARSEAGEAYYLNSGGGPCVYTKSLEYNSSNGAFVLNGCSLYDAGNLQTNSGDSATATTFTYYGTWSPNNCNSSCNWTLGGGQTQPTHTNTLTSDPLANLTEPSKPATQDANNCSISNQDCSGNNLTAAQLAGTAPISVPPGYYGGGININTSGLVVNLSPGLYYFNGSVDVNSGTTLECTGCTGGKGVTLFFTSGNFQPNSAATISLAAPTTNPTNNAVANMLIWQSTSDTQSMTIDASSTATYSGTIYLPNAQLDLNSGSGTFINSTNTSTAIDVKDLVVNSGVTFEANGSGGFLGGGGEVLGSFAVAE